MSSRHEAEGPATGAAGHTGGRGSGPAAVARPAAADRLRGLARSAADLAGGDVRAGLAFLLGLTAAGPLLGLLWAAISPRLDVSAGISGSETAFTAQADIDATFGFIGLAAGLIVGVIARWRAPTGGWPVPLGLAGGGLAGSLLAGWVGHLVRSPGALRRLPPHTPAYVSGLVDVKVRATGLYFVLPVTALVVLAIALWLPTVPRRPAPPATGSELGEDDPFAAASAVQPGAHPPAERALTTPPPAERASATPPPAERASATLPPAERPPSVGASAPPRQDGGS